MSGRSCHPPTVGRTAARYARPVRCSIASLGRDEPLAGTAPVAERFLVVEYPGHWPSEGLAVFGPEARTVLDDAATAASAQVLLVRRPDGPLLDRDAILATPTLWWAVDTVRRVRVAGTWTDEPDLAVAAAALSTGLDTATEPATLDLLVCCHAKRDQCCAISGRPLATALAGIWPAETWQCTHLGGHRFAPTFLLLPDGACYGRIPPGQGPPVVSDHLAGQPAATLLRGYCRHSGAEQAAVADVLRTVPTPPDAVTSTRTADDSVSVTVVAGGVRHDRIVRTVRNPPVPLSCGDAPPKPSVSYLVG